MADRPDGGTIRALVVYALAEAQHIVTVDCAAGTTAEQAVALSGLPERFPEIRSEPLVLGLFGRRIDAQTVLQAGDRVEICRPLQRDPRELRRDLSAQGKVMGGRAGRSGQGEEGRS